MHLTDLCIPGAIVEILIHIPSLNLISETLGDGWLFRGSKVPFFGKIAGKIGENHGKLQKLRKIPEKKLQKIADINSPPPYYKGKNPSLLQQANFRNICISGGSYFSVRPGGGGYWAAGKIWTS